MRAEDLERTMLARTGVVAEIESGPIGLVVYAESAAKVDRVARALAADARAKDPRAHAEPAPICEPDEPHATRWISTVYLDWSVFG